MLLPELMHGHLLWVGLGPSAAMKSIDLGGHVLLRLIAIARKTCVAAFQH